MSNPLIEKYEEIYGEKKEEVVEEKKLPTKEEFRDSILSGLRGGMTDDILTLGGGSDTISLNPYDCKPVFTINGGSEITGGDYVIPTATINNGAMSMDGSYIKPATITSTSTPNTFLLPQNTQMDRHLCKVMDDVAKGKATLSSISAEVDPTFTGFGGQIRYTIEIVGRYP